MNNNDNSAEKGDGVGAGVGIRPPAYKNVLVVCLGNICRSPLAEVMLRGKCPQVQVQSAGLQAMTGQGADAITAEIATEAGLDLSAHVAQQLDGQLIQWADLILLMSQGQRQLLARQSPEAMGKSLLLGHWIRAQGTRANNGMEIPDPYKKSRDVYQHVHGLIDNATTLWSHKL